MKVSEVIKVMGEAGDEIMSLRAQLAAVEARIERAKGYAKALTEAARYLDIVDQLMRRVVVGGIDSEATKAFRDWAAGNEVQSDLRALAAILEGEVE
jgi:hypothetical protein